MQKLSIPDAVAMIRHVAIDHNEPMMFWGAPGIGKSEGVQQMVDDLDGVMVDIRLSQYDSVDLRGFPGVEKDTDQTVWHPPSTLPFAGNDRFPDDKLIVLFLDELNSAVPAVMAVAYQLVNEKRVGEHKLKPNVRVVAAGNRETDRGVTNRMPLPLANRFTHVEGVESVDAWCLWGQKTGKVPPVGVAFMQFRKPMLMTFKPDTTEKAFATPRTWIKAMKYYESNMPEHLKMAAMAGAVGDGPSAEFWGFVDIWQKMIPISEIIKNPEKVPLPKESDMGMRYALTINVSGHMDKKTVKPLATFLGRLEPEFQVLAWQMATKRDDQLDQTDEFMAFAKKHKGVMLG